MRLETRLAERRNARAARATWRHLSRGRRVTKETFAKSIESVTSQKTRRWKEADGVDGRVEKCPVTRIYRVREESERGKHGTREDSETGAGVRKAPARSFRDETYPADPLVPGHVYGGRRPPRECLSRVAVDSYTTVRYRIAS